MTFDQAVLDLCELVWSHMGFLSLYACWEGGLQEQRAEEWNHGNSKDTLLGSFCTKDICVV